MRRQNRVERYGDTELYSRNAIKEIDCGLFESNILYFSGAATCQRTIKLVIGVKNTSSECNNCYEVIR